jgi:hypothetical protein
MALNGLPEMILATNSAGWFDQTYTGYPVIKAQHPYPSGVQDVMLSRIVATKRILWDCCLGEWFDPNKMTIDGPGPSPHPMRVLRVIDADGA